MGKNVISRALKRVAVALLATALVACASGPQGVPISPSVLSLIFAPPHEEGYGRLVVYFGRSVPGQVVSMAADLRVDGVVVGALSNEDFAELLLTPRPFRLTISDAKTFLGDVSVAAGATRFVRITQCNAISGGCYPTRLTMSAGSHADFLATGHNERRIYAKLGTPTLNSGGVASTPEQSTGVGKVSNKEKCLSLGYKLGTKEFANCMLKLRQGK